MTNTSPTELTDSDEMKASKRVEICVRTADGTLRDIYDYDVKPEAQAQLIENGGVLMYRTIIRSVRTTITVSDWTPCGEIP